MTKKQISAAHNKINAKTKKVISSSSRNRAPHPSGEGMKMK
jgi:hypothetical protein